MNQSELINELRSRKDLILKQVHFVLEKYKEQFHSVKQVHYQEHASDFLNIVWDRLFTDSDSDEIQSIKQMLILSRTCYTNYSLDLNKLSSAGYKGMSQLLNTGSDILSALCFTEYWNIIDSKSESEEERSYRSTEFKLAAVILIMAIWEDLRLNESEIYNIGILPKARIVWTNIMKYIVLSVLLLLLLGLVKGL